MLLALLGSSLAADVYSGDKLDIDVGGDIKAFTSASFPYEHGLFADFDCVGQIATDYLSDPATRPGFGETAQEIEDRTYAHVDDNWTDCVGPSAQGITDFRLKAELRHGDWLTLKAHHAMTASAPGGNVGASSSFGTGVGRTAPQAVDLMWEAYDTEGLYLRGRMDRLSAAFRVPHADLTLGRQPLTYGKALIFTPMDLVSPFNPTIVDQEYKPGVDAVRADVYWGMANTVSLAAAYAGDWDKDGVVLSAYGQTTLGVWDLGAFFGWVCGDRVFGLATAGSLGPIGLRGEGTYTLPGEMAEETEGFWRGTVGADWRPGMKTMVSGEVYFQSLGETDPGQYLSAYDNPRYTRGELWLAGRTYAAVSASQELAPTVYGSLALIGNLEDPSMMVAPALSWSVSGNADLSLSGFVGVGERPDEVLPSNLLAGLDADMSEDEAAAFIDEELGSKVNSEFGLIPAAAVVSLRAYF
jgi:hypothetical protein